MNDSLVGDNDFMTFFFFIFILFLSTYIYILCGKIILRFCIGTTWFHKIRTSGEPRVIFCDLLSSEQIHISIVG